MVHQVLPVQLDKREPQVPLDKLELPAPRVIQVLPVPQVLQVPLDKQDLLVIQVTRVLLELQGRLEPREPRV